MIPGIKIKEYISNRRYDGTREYLDSLIPVTDEHDRFTFSLDVVIISKINFERFCKEKGIICINPDPPVYNGITIIIDNKLIRCCKWIYKIVQRSDVLTQKMTKMISEDDKWSIRKKDLVFSREEFINAYLCQPLTTATS